MMRKTNLGKAVSWPGDNETGEIVFCRDRKIHLPDSLGPEWSGELGITPSLPPNGLWIFTPPLWETMSKRIMALDANDRMFNLVKRLVAGYSYNVFPNVDGSYDVLDHIFEVVNLPNTLVLVVKGKGLELRPVDAEQSEGVAGTSISLDE
jgi:DNA-binding transcriptional regulator/RsmH inhibitor MraZ